VVGAVRAVLGGDGRDRHRGPAGGSVDLHRGPRLQADGVAAQAIGARGGGEHASGPGQELTSGGVEVVGVMVVGKQHHVDVAHGVELHRGPGELGQLIVVTGGRERGVGHPAQRGVLERGGRPADEGEVVHGELSSWIVR
jgi:hypothetical protein